MEADSQNIIQPKKFPLKPALIGAGALILLSAGYFIYQSFAGGTGSAKTDAILAKYIEGPKLSIAQIDAVGPFFYSASQDAIFFQKPDKKIYEKMFGFQEESEEFSIFDTFGADLISISNNGSYALIFYSQSPEVYPDDSGEDKKIKEQLTKSAGNYYVANLKNLSLYSIGNEASDFTWLDDKLYFARTINGVRELWAYNPHKAYGNDYGGVDYGPGYDKVTELKYPVLSIARRPDTKLLYLIVNSKNSETDFDLAIYNLENGEWSKAMDTQAFYISFSPSGKYYALFGHNKKTFIFESETSNKVTEIPDLAIVPQKIAWSTDEQNIYYFTGGPNDYFNLMQYGIISGKKNLIINGEIKNLSVPTNLDVDLNDKTLFFSTLQTNIIYQLKLK